MKVVFFGAKTYDRDSFERVNQGSDHELTFLEAHLNQASAALARGAEAVCAFVNDQLDRPCLQALHDQGVGTVALRCAGFNNVDLAAAQELGITVVRVPEYSPHGVAEHAVALILGLNRKIYRVYNRVRENNFSLEGLLGFNLNTRTVGVIGTGRIGSVFCRIMQGFGCRVLAYDPTVNTGLQLCGVEYTDLATLFRESDIISLHCPLNTATHHLVNEAAILSMKPGVMLINTSRGGLVDTQAVIQYLKTGHIGYLGLDVYEEEADLFFEDESGQILEDDQFARLLTFPNVLISGHQAFFTAEALENIATTTLQNLTDIEQSKTCPNQVTLS
ncbi:MAG TPA: hydroxyacid dehydrogenase [Oceanospirillales bacterium]|nr:hydroxyacid dehydrogenase [Oceanospirillaceae bacterium]HBS42932.1 hydroxyacid dehydrogenase [Oceanospirillales bacterium]|tara:strand:+ start:39446 stop:40441 length:996 start_codon:yes stop_codon:yes gene_type:complete